ncbi:MAG: hypothetical protein FH759_08735 [Sediminimonas qiaohouensis]|uniref:DUF1440 domain-containing protein n=1 Tax=Sediminimonas qiaohouensis TaxID=552061 RepID=A0A7C9LNY2_9RHOB|nr:hypothetical protein [Sediminimonas qiaohouensis]MTJ04760.1 hypothetical protein [Sediminimonas qiaohouensis]
MQFYQLSAKDWAKTLIIGLVAAAVTAATMQGLLRAGISPLPEPLGLAFARLLLGDVPLPVGLLFHTVWNVAFVAFFVVMFGDSLSFGRATALAAALWGLVLVVFFPIVGWGFFGLAITPKLIVAAGGIHLLFAIVLWGGCRIAFGTSVPGAAAQ